MAKLYTLLGNTLKAHQRKFSLPSLLSANMERHSLGLNNALIDYPVEKNESLNTTGEYELREPYPNDKEELFTKDQMILMQDLLNQATALCNELDELIALHYCFYEAAENVFDRERGYIRKDTQMHKSNKHNSRGGLSLFPSWLRERDFTVLETVHALQQSLRDVCNKRNGHLGAQSSVMKD